MLVHFSIYVLPFWTHLIQRFALPQTDPPCGRNTGEYGGVAINLAMLSQAGAVDAISISNGILPSFMELNDSQIMGR